MATQSIVIADFGGCQEEAVGMAAAAAPAVFAEASLPIGVPSTGAISIQSILSTITGATVGVGEVSADISAMLIIIEGAQSLSEAVGMAAAYDQSLDTGFGTVAAEVTASVLVLVPGAGQEASNVTASVPVGVLGTGEDNISPARTYFLVTKGSILEPLGVLVLRDSYQDLAPATRDASVTVPGRHGVYSFGSEFAERTLEFKVAVKEMQGGHTKQTLAKYLNPLLGKQPLIFAEDINKTYMAKCIGPIVVNKFLNWLSFTITFTVDPIITGSFEKRQTGSGVLSNDGTFETPVTVLIRGPVTGPSVNIGGHVIAWSGALTATDVLEIDTERMTVKLNAANALAGFTGGFPKLQPGETAVTAALAGETTLVWRDRWL